MKRFADITFRILITTTLLLGLSAAPNKLAWSAPATRMADAETLNPGDVRKLAFPATHLVVRWVGNAADSVAVRGRGMDGTWQEWKVLESESKDGGPDGTERVEAQTISEEGIEALKTIDPNWVGERESSVIVVDNAVELETKVVSGNPQNIRVAAIDTRNGPRRLEVVKDEAKPAGAIGGLSPQPHVIPRSQWGANEGLRRGNPEFASINRIIVHHTDTKNADPDPAATVRAIYQWHTQGNGWNDIGYNFLIDQNGRIYEGRKARDYSYGEIADGESTLRQGVIGAHAFNSNTGSVGIAMLGNFTSSAPNAATQDALVRLIAWKADRHNIDTMAPGRLIGHRDVYQTSCPGNVAHSLLGQWRQRAAAQVLMNVPLGNTPGYTIAQADGAVKSFGAARTFGSMAGRHLNAPIESMTSTPDRNGYWLMGSDGGIFSFGSAKFHGSTGGMRLNAPVVAMATTPSGNGYWLVARDGGIFSFGDAKFYGSTGGMRLNAPVVGMSATPSGKGYMLVATDGGIFTFGDAKFQGSTGAMRLNSPIVSMAAKTDGSGYWLFGDDGGVFGFGSVGFFGSIPMLGVKAFGGVAQAVPTSTNRGYYVLARDGGVYTFGDARFWGATTGNASAAMSVLPE